MSRAVYISGRGAISGFGRDLAVLVDGVFSGRTALRNRSRTQDFQAPTRVAAELPLEAIDPEVCEDDLIGWSGAVASREALREAGVEPGAIGLILATTKADLSGITGPGSGYGSPIRLAKDVAARLGVPVVHGAISCACASGLVALAMAARRIAAGELERVLVVGVDMLNEFIVRGFGAMHALDPAVCRPFDRARRGVSLGDGAAALVLSSRESESIGVRLTGHAGANDACHVTGPDHHGLGVSIAASRAMAHAGVSPADIDLVHLHGTGTHANDTTEAIGVSNAFGGRTPPAFGTKGQTGHTLGASGTIEALLTIEALRRGLVPANFGLVDPDVDPRLDLVVEPRRLDRARRALKVASGFGGVQAAVVFET